MAYTAYRTWTTGEIVTAALMNEQVKDNGLLTAPAIMTGQGDLIYGSAANTPARLAKDANSTRSLTNTGTNNNPAWAQVALATGVSGTLPVANGGTGITSLGSNVATFLGTPSSANLRSALTDETGSGAAVFATSPTLVTPALGTPASGVLTNATGLPIAGIANGTDGELITWNASGVAAAVAVGSADEVLTSNGAGAAPTFQAAGGGGAVTRDGGNTTEATSTATSAADMLTSSTLDIAAAEEMQYIVGGRKTTGAVDNAALGIKINSTVTGEALAATPSRTWGCSTANVAQSGGGRGWFGARVTNYQGAAGGDTNCFGTTGGNRASGDLNGICESAVVPIATITVVVIRGITDDGANTVAADELHVYKIATS